MEDHFENDSFFHNPVTIGSDAGKSSLRMQKIGLLCIISVLHVLQSSMSTLSSGDTLAFHERNQAVKQSLGIHACSD